MADLETDVQFGTVSGFFYLGFADSPDPGNQPDVTMCQGKVTIKSTLSPPFTRTPLGLLTLGVSTLQVVNGFVCGPKSFTPSDNTPASQGASLIATGQSYMNPNNFQWIASFQLDGLSVQPPDVTFSLPAGSNVDLSLAYNAPNTTPTVQVVVSDATRVAAEAARDAAFAARDQAIAAGRNFVVLNATDPVPPGTPVNSVVFRTN